MILNVSGRTDIVAFYTPWFIKRYQEGYVDVRNPIYTKLVSRIYFKDVDCIFFFGFKKTKENLRGIVFSTIDLFNGFISSISPSGALGLGRISISGSLYFT